MRGPCDSCFADYDCTFLTAVSQSITSSSLANRRGHLEFRLYIRSQIWYLQRKLRYQSSNSTNVWSVSIHNWQLYTGTMLVKIYNTCFGHRIRSVIKRRFFAFKIIAVLVTLSNFNALRQIALRSYKKREALLSNSSKLRADIFHNLRKLSSLLISKSNVHETLFAKLPCQTDRASKFSWEQLAILTLITSREIWWELRQEKKPLRVGRLLEMSIKCPVMVENSGRASGSGFQHASMRYFNPDGILPGSEGLMSWYATPSATWKTILISSCSLKYTFV